MSKAVQKHAESHNLKYSEHHKTRDLSAWDRRECLEILDSLLFKVPDIFKVPDMESTKFLDAADFAKKLTRRSLKKTKQ